MSIKNNKARCIIKKTAMKDEVTFSRKEVIWMVSILVKYYFYNPELRELARFLSARIPTEDEKGGVYVK